MWGQENYGVKNLKLNKSSPSSFKLFWLGLEQGRVRREFVGKLFACGKGECKFTLLLAWATLERSMWNQCKVTAEVG